MTSHPAGMPEHGNRIGVGPGARVGADPILLPKKLRAEWMDAMALDRTLSHVAFRAAVVIGSHFNRHSGSTFISQEKVASVMSVSKRTVWSAVTELERSGYLLVRRRELGRRTDGRRACGGKGVANTYLPAFERSQLAATNNGTKLALRCNQHWEEWSQGRASKVASDCDPTLVLPSEVTLQGGNPGLGKEGLRLASQLGADTFRSWFGSVSIKPYQAGDCTVVLIAPNRFFADTIRNKFSEAVLDCWQAERLIVEVGSTTAASPP